MYAPVAYSIQIFASLKRLLQVTVALCTCGRSFVLDALMCSLFHTRFAFMHDIHALVVLACGNSHAF